MARAKVEAPQPQITGGEVSFKRSFQPDQYGNRGAEVKLLFVVPEGGELGTFLDYAGETALAKVMELAYGKKGPQVAAGTPKALQEAPKETVAEAPPKPPGKTKADLEAEKAAELKAAEKKTVTMPAISTGEERVDPSQAQEDEWGAEAPAVEQISDAAMKDACSKRNQAIKNPQAIKGLIATFVPFPKGCADIEQGKRKEFLTKLAETK